MKKAIAIAVLAGLIGGAFAIAPASAKKKKKAPVKVTRVVEIEYMHPGIGAATPVGSAGYPVNFPESIAGGGSEIATSADEKFIQIEVIDASGQAVAGFISQGDLDGNGVNDDGYAEFCGKHATPVPLAAPGTPLVGIYAYSGVCPDGTNAVMTSGTIKITFSNLP